MHAAVVVIKLTIYSALAAIILMSLVVLIWSLFPYTPDQAHVALAEVDSRYSIQDHGRYISLTPRHNDQHVALVFYPGGVIDSWSYVHRLSVVAQAGVSVFITQPPLHLAVTDAEAFTAVQHDNPQIQRWYIGGHSLGGIVGCWYLNQISDQIDGLLLLASYCLDDMSQSSVKVLSLFGKADQLISDQTEMAYRSHLPASAEVVYLNDFNHSDFGDYSSSHDDGLTHLSDAQIQATLKQYMVPFFLQK